MLLGPRAPAPVPAAQLGHCWDAGCWVTVGITIPAGAKDGSGLVTAPGRVLELTQGLLLLSEPHDSAAWAGLPGFSKVRRDFGRKRSAELKSETMQDNRLLCRRQTADS